MKNLVIQDCEDWTYILVADGDTDKTVAQFEYDDGPSECVEKMKKVLEYAGVPVTRETIPVPRFDPNVLHIGQRVVTLKTNMDFHDWDKDCLKTKKFGVKGTITNEHNSHGLCYSVKHDDGSVSWYDPCELVKID